MTIRTVVFLTLGALLSMPSFGEPKAPTITPEQVDLVIGSPPVVIARHALAQRQSRLIRFIEPGILGLCDDGMVCVRDTSKLKLVQRQIAEKLVDQDGADRNSLIYALAEAHGGQHNEPVVRAVQVKRWKDTFKSGWWMRDAQGQWSKKP